MRAVLRIDPPLVRDVFEYLLTKAGLDVVGCAPDWFELLMIVGERRPEVVFLMAGDSLEPGICSHLMGENPQLKIVMVSSDLTIDPPNELLHLSFLRPIPPPNRSC